MSTHDHLCEGPQCRCFARKLRTVQFGGPKAPQSRMEDRWDRDMPAYQRLRNSGLQPPKIDGCYQLEQRAHSQLEIEMGHLIDRSIMPQVTEGMQIAKELEWTPKDSVDAVKDKYVRNQA